MVFSLDSVITAVGIADHLSIMVLAILFAIIVMLLRRRAGGRVRQLSSDREDAGAQLSPAGRGRADRRRPALPHPARLSLLRDRVLDCGRGAESLGGERPPPTAHRARDGRSGRNQLPGRSLRRPAQADLRIRKRYSPASAWLSEQLIARRLAKRPKVPTVAGSLASTRTNAPGVSCCIALRSPQDRQRAVQTRACRAWSPPCPLRSDALPGRKPSTPRRPGVRSQARASGATIRQVATCRADARTGAERPCRDRP